MLPIITSLILLNGCGITQQGAGTNRNGALDSARGGSHHGVRSLDEGETRILQNESAMVPLRSMNGKRWIPVRRMAETAGYTAAWEQGTRTLRIGDNDPVYELTAGSHRALKEGQTISLPDAPIMLDGAPFMTVEAAGDLFRDELAYEINEGLLVFRPTGNHISERMGLDGPALTNQGLDFADDPADPFKSASFQTVSKFSDVWQEEGVPAAALKNIELGRLVQRAHRYLGIHYLFGAGPYSKTGKFDCSSYTQYVFAQQGVQLPRLARQQAALGIHVSRKQLRVGDLLFFYVPGRFRSNRTVGHVGIYIGNGKMINAAPQPRNGVQVISINKPYWKNTFLRAKRVAR
jgi:hypothetical protein